ncbi:MAG TPA: hypothetical protein PLD27_06680 [bacterium]|nr:hypothetical protein [bacterium]HOL48318.1 hypothetical protein [bacterium]HPQ18556.1 hypothetical protein [bacterium]
MRKKKIEDILFYIAIIVIIILFVNEIIQFIKSSSAEEILKTIAEGMEYIKLNQTGFY